MSTPGAWTATGSRKAQPPVSRRIRLAARLGLAASLLTAACSSHSAKPVQAARAERLSIQPLSDDQLRKLASGAAAQAPVEALPPPTAAVSDAQAARKANAERPFANETIRPMAPFVLKTDVPDRDRAVHCLAQAVYYEAAREPLKGQEAIAQVVLNRVRHPAYPKSVCGVVYQGAARSTGCQFTFTCDGSLRWAPDAALFTRATDVARRALGGFVEADVGSATHYHAVYVNPYWAPTLVKMTRIGAHIFYRWTGSWGEPPAFDGRYAGHEAVLSHALLAAGDPHALVVSGLQVADAREVTLGGAGEVRTYKVADNGADGAARTRVEGVLYAPHRRPTAEEVQAINDSLAAVEARVSGQAAPSAAQAAEPASASATN
jgi:spore germination cell wall hydrolase CwlJ-like protein